MAVALIAIGPKDLPVAIRTVTGLIRKARGLAAEFQGHVDDMMREANLADVKGEIDKLRQFDFKGAAARMVDPDGSLRSTAQEMTETVEGISAVETAADYTTPAEVQEELPDSPPFIPPDEARKQPVPGFIPPGTRRWGF